jgi:hypothetical protein
VRWTNPLHHGRMATARSIIPIALLLSSCAPFRSVQPPLVANVRAEGQGCRVTVDRQRVTHRQLLDIARKATGRHGIVVYDKDAPYRCLGAAIITMQQAGLQSVDAAMWDER